LENATVQDDDDDGSDIIGVAQRAATQQGYARQCNRPLCRRARRCVGPDVRCLTDAMQSLPVRVFAHRVAAGRRMIREAETRGPGALLETQSRSRTPDAETVMAERIAVIQALLSCIGEDADR
jgi:hypothetical protein